MQPWVVWSLPPQGDSGRPNNLHRFYSTDVNRTTNYQSVLPPTFVFTMQIGEFRCGFTSSQILGFAVDFRGFGREIDSLANDEDADAGSLVISPARCAATRWAALQVPHRRVTTLAAGTRARRGVRPPLPHVDACACATSRRTSANLP